MVTYKKTEVREKLKLENIFELLQEWGGDPEYTNFGILSTTICHNQPGEGSRKLYFYENTGLFHCFTNCGSFDIFELLIKIARIQWGREYDLNDAVRYIAIKFNLAGEEEFAEEETLSDWQFFNTYDRIQEIENKDYHVQLKTYDDIILSRMNYHVKLNPWLREEISQEVLDHAHIGFYPGGAQITIPHYDKDGNFVGLRGRALCKEDADLYGKYRPLYVNRQLYNHPLGMNLYNLNNSKDKISIIHKAIVFESEKSCLKYQSYFGLDNDISVACCGSNISIYQVQLLLDCGVQEMIIAFDRQFQEIGDNEFKHLTNNLTKLHEKYKNYLNISIIFDKKMITGYKDAPIDDGKDKFLELWKTRIYL